MHYYSSRFRKKKKFFQKLVELTNSNDLIFKLQIQENLNSLVEIINLSIKEIIDIKAFQEKELFKIEEQKKKIQQEKKESQERLLKKDNKNNSNEKKKFLNTKEKNINSESRISKINKSVKKIVKNLIYPICLLSGFFLEFLLLILLHKYFDITLNKDYIWYFTLGTLFISFLFARSINSLIVIEDAQNIENKKTNIDENGNYIDQKDETFYQKVKSSFVNFSINEGFKYCKSKVSNIF